MTSDSLLRALHGVEEGLALRPLPDEVVALLTELAAAPRLVAHLRAVHDVAARLLGWVRRAYPDLVVDEQAVLFGAATHDIGKVVHSEELSAPGSRHEPVGYELLLSRGVEDRLARFAGTHGRWDGPATTVEELLVSLADKIWKGRRERSLEDRLVALLANEGGKQPWEVFTDLDDALTDLAADADRRLAFQAGFPVGGRRR